MIDINHLSYSSISLYLSCGRAWYARYVDKVQVPTAPALIFGSAIHDTVERYLATGQDLLSAWSECWQARLAGEANGVDWQGGTPESYANDGIHYLGSKAVQSGLAALSIARDDQGPRIERRIEVMVPGVPIPIIGYIDLVTADGVPGDLKTSARSWTQDQAQEELQSLFYLVALNQAGVPLPSWTFRHYVIVKTKTPQFQVLEHSHRPEELFWMMELVQRAWQGIECGVFPMNPSGWRCSPKYCDVWHLCRGR